MKSLIIAATIGLLSLGCEAQQRPAHAQPQNGERKVLYGIVFLGFPTWGMRLPPPVKSFLRQYRLKGKTVIPFNTNAGYGEGSSFQTVRELCRQCTVLEGFVTTGGVERDGQYLVIKGTRAEEARREVDNWLKKIGVMPSPARSP